ncbi:hypothetical protein [Rhodanobacter glycinis]|uniref:hypothetical protein n=1 Tax=Rhodanobacter glycinis TaxID=582702 RepID=UPI001FE18AEA|nr:hypothetical protein [Rhodanobacter glycinis]
MQLTLPAPVPRTLSRLDDNLRLRGRLKLVTLLDNTIGSRFRVPRALHLLQHDARRGIRRRKPGNFRRRQLTGKKHCRTSCRHSRHHFHCRLAITGLAEYRAIGWNVSGCGIATSQATGNRMARSAHSGGT